MFELVRVCLMSIHFLTNPICRVPKIPIKPMCNVYICIREFIIEYQTPLKESYYWLKIRTLIMIDLDRWINKSGNIWVVSKGKEVRKHLDKITPQFIFYDIISILKYSPIIILPKRQEKDWAINYWCLNLWLYLPPEILRDTYS